MHRKITVIAVLLLILIVGASMVTVYAASADDDLYKNLEETAQQSKDDYFVNYRDNYEIDTEEISFFSSGGAPIVLLNMLTNFIFLLEKMLAQLTLSIFSFALSTNLTTLLGEFLEPFITSMKTGIWDELAVYAIAFAAFMLLLKIAQNRTSQALSQLMGLILIITMAFIFYAYPIQMMEGIDTVTSGISDVVMEGPYQATGGGTAVDAKGKSSALCWNLFVHKPWQVLEFGTVSMAKKYEGDILKLDPGSEKRKELVEKLAESEGLFSKSMEYQASRLGTAFIFLCFNILLMAVMIIFSVLIIGYQFLLIVYLMLGIFVFLVALLPNFGMELIIRWVTRVACISFTKVMVVFFLSVTLVFMGVIYEFTETFGLFLTVFLMLVTIFALWFEKYKLLDLFAGYRTTKNQLPQTMKKSLDTDYNAVNNARNVRKTMLRNLEKMGADSVSGGHKEEQTGQEKDPDKKMTNSQSVKFSAGAMESVKAGFVNVESMDQAGEKMMQSAESMRTASQDMGMYFKSAEALLQKQYEYSKSKAEETATKNNEPAEYDSFVKRTEKIRNKGQGGFDKRDVANVAAIMKKTVEQGGNIDDVISDGKSIYRDKHAAPSRPSSLSSVREEMGIAERPSEKQRQVRQVQGIEYFKMNFGEEQGEELYENLTEKYGNDAMKAFAPESNVDTSKSNESLQQKQSYAQIVKQLQKQNNQKRQNNQPVIKQSPQNQPEPTKIRKGDK